VSKVSFDPVLLRPSEFHDETGNDKRTAMFNRGQSGARDFFGGDVEEFRAPVAFGAAPFRDSRSPRAQ
jgi:hypothetical protein